MKFLEVNTDVEARAMRAALNNCRAYIIAASVEGSEDLLNYLDAFAAMVGLSARADLIAEKLPAHEIVDRDRFTALATEAETLQNQLKAKFSFVRAAVEPPAELAESQKPKTPKIKHLGAAGSKSKFTGAGHLALSEDQVREIRAYVAQKGDGFRWADYGELAEMYQVSLSTMYKVVRGTTYRHVK